MKELGKRGVLYGLGLAVSAGLLSLWWSMDGHADTITLLSSADVQLRLAYAMPERDLGGARLPAREELIAAAERQLAVVERSEPGMACTAEFRGFAHMLRGECTEAAAAYRRARGCQDCTAEQRDVLVFNEARMLAKAGRGEEALAVFAEHAPALDARYGPQRRIEEIMILCDLGRTNQAAAALQTLFQDATLDPMARLQGARLYERLGQVELAEAQYAAIADQLPVADCHRARLKLAGGDVDTALVLLERAASAAPAEVRRLLREEPGAWQAAAGDARFDQYLSMRPAAPGR